MARPKPRSFAPGGQDDALSDPAKRPAASNAKAAGRSGTGSGSGKTKASPAKQVTMGSTKRQGDQAAATKGGGAKPTASAARSKGSQVIPEAVAQRMLRRIAIATGVPSLLGMGVFVGSYVLVSRQIFDVPPVATLLASGACFLLGVVGLSYGVLSASWEAAPGTLLGTEQLGVNISRVRSSLRAMRQGGTAPPAG
jgi:hypothetical protein